MEFSISASDLPSLRRMLQQFILPVFWHRSIRSSILPAASPIRHLSEYSELDPPTYACVGNQGSIASWRVMQARLDAMQSIGIDTEFHVYSGLGHGFGLGNGTSAEGWIDDAIAFWEKQM